MKITKLAIAPLFLLGVLSTPSIVSADTLSIINEPANDSSGVIRPVKGMDKNQVESQFGTPNGRSGPIGEPPISYWTYPQYTVYFEYEIVLHAVAHR